MREPGDVPRWFCTLAVAMAYGEGGIDGEAAQAEAAVLVEHWEAAG